MILYTTAEKVFEVFWVTSANALITAQGRLLSFLLNEVTISVSTSERSGFLDCQMLPVGAEFAVLLLHDLRDEEWPKAG